jgi:hypothetical protein
MERSGMRGVPHRECGPGFRFAHPGYACLLVRLLARSASTVGRTGARQREKGSEIAKRVRRRMRRQKVSRQTKS